MNEHEMDTPIDEEETESEKTIHLLNDRVNATRDKIGDPELKKQLFIYQTDKDYYLMINRQENDYRRQREDEILYDNIIDWIESIDDIKKRLLLNDDIERQILNMEYQLKCCQRMIALRKTMYCVCSPEKARKVKEHIIAHLQKNTTEASDDRRKKATHSQDKIPA